jgi:putative copper export protein
VAILQDQSLFEWSEPARELVGFVALFLTAGAVGFRYAVARGRLAAAPAAAPGAVPADQAVYDDAARRAAVLGLVGALVSAALAASRLPELAARRHVGVGALITSDVQTAVQLAMLLIAIAGFALAAARRPVGWPIAAVGVVVGALRAALVGQWARLVNPVHSLAAGLWIGTLFVLVVAGLAVVLRDETVRARRGAIVADMINGFSPLALTCGIVVVLFGLITAWRHLHTLDALWTTPYGYALLVKLCLVAIVFTLGAWNWRRQRPTLGGDAAALSMRRSSISELAVAGAVLLATAILVSIPPPRPPGAPPGTPAHAPSAAGE